jgi:hypothetical protein
MPSHSSRTKPGILFSLAAAVTLAVLAVGAIALAAAPVKGAKYAGHLNVSTSETVSFKVSASGKRVINVKVQPFLPNKCGAGGTPPPEKSTPAKVKNGKFTAKVRAVLSNGLVSGRATVTGKFKSGGNESGLVKNPLPGTTCGGNFPYSTSSAKRSH